ncbi:hypothetical protein HMPREF3038_02063 [Akkermansia sp. KLE1797]|nr:hypothetical protein HMPREF3038_02063 [Akkermansia sp. KLE1797]KXU53604.1 hypothetical protein HMPREF3039_02327 [Akkermansia sp. KLE1798]KZA05800.1 hypothetical protein HMPREF1326_00627 [Akkermansia sp. KLE1605]
MGSRRSHGIAGNKIPFFIFKKMGRHAPLSAHWNKSCGRTGMKKGPS